MKKHLTVVLIAFTIGILGFGDASAQTNAIRFHALVLTERGDQHEAFVAAALPWLKEIAQQDHFSVDVFANPDQFTKQFLAKYQVFIQLNYPPYRWSDEAKAA